MFRRGLLLIGLVVVGLMLMGKPQSAKAYVYETTHDATCSSFTLHGTTSASHLTVHVYKPATDSSLYLGVVPTNGSGNFTVDVDFPAQPEGTVLYYYVWGTTDPNNPWAHDGQYAYELNDGYPCTVAEQLFASAYYPWTTACNKFVVGNGITNANYVGVQVKSSNGTTVYLAKVPAAYGHFALNVNFTAVKNQTLTYRLWGSNSSAVTAWNGEYGFSATKKC